MLAPPLHPLSPQHRPAHLLRLKAVRRHWFLVLQLLVEPTPLVSFQDLAAQATLEALLLLEGNPHDAAEEGVVAEGRAVGEEEEGARRVGTVLLLVLASALRRGQASSALSRKKHCQNG